MDLKSEKVRLKSYKEMSTSLAEEDLGKKLLLSNKHNLYARHWGLERFLASSFCFKCLFPRTETNLFFFFYNFPAQIVQEEIIERVSNGVLNGLFYTNEEIERHEYAEGQTAKFQPKLFQKPNKDWLAYIFVGTIVVFNLGVFFAGTFPEKDELIDFFTNNYIYKCVLPRHCFLKFFFLGPLGTFVLEFLWKLVRKIRQRKRKEKAAKREVERAAVYEQMQKELGEVKRLRKERYSTSTIGSNSKKVVENNSNPSTKTSAPSSVVRLAEFIEGSGSTVLKASNFLVPNKLCEPLLVPNNLCASNCATSGDNVQVSRSLSASDESTAADSVDLRSAMSVGRDADIVGGGHFRYPSEDADFSMNFNNANNDEQHDFKTNSKKSTNSNDVLCGNKNNFTDSESPAVTPLPLPTLLVQSFTNSPTDSATVIPQIYPSSSSSCGIVGSTKSPSSRTKYSANSKSPINIVTSSVTSSAALYCDINTKSSNKVQTSQSSSACSTGSPMSYEVIEPIRLI